MNTPKQHPPQPTQVDEPLRVSFELPENLDDGLKLMAVWQAAYKLYATGLLPHELKAAKLWFDSWCASQQKEPT